MSIPPLVCNTPPPLEHCVDEKDNEDYDIEYNLSQEDDDSNEYDYGNFSTFTDYKSPTDVQQTSPDSHNHANDSPTTDDSESVNIPTHIENHCKMKEEKSEEEVNLEDLNLNVDKISISSDKECTPKESIDEINNKSSNFEVEIKPEVEATESTVEPEPFIDTDNIVTEVSSSDPISQVSENDMCNDEQQDTPMAINENDVFHFVESSANTLETEKPIESVPTDDDFGDFDDFKSSDVPIALTTDEVNDPWGNQSDDIAGDFEANFGNFKSAENNESKKTIQEEAPVSTFANIVDDDDDFGDFDDFQSSSAKCETNVVTSPDPYISLQLCNSDHVVEKVLSSIFNEVVTEPEHSHNENIEKSLGETWRHLMDIEVRQPYMVNWNNSIGQKTLLKSLCIDSRNILFGPKWSHSHNVPKYAANLYTAPLQPHKQNPPSEPASVEKTNNTEDTWTDPFSSDGQESYNNQENTTAQSKHRPADLPVLHPTVPAKADIYSSTLSVQPMRQISLPDTHIYTPTDSEIPRSKTIHYDNPSTILVPETQITETFTNTEFSDFQNFKQAGGSEKNDSSRPVNSIDQKQTSTPVFATSLLEPVKIEPTMPTLNWPDPGEVKETFDDFTDFVSSTSLGQNITTGDASSLSDIQNFNVDQLDKTHDTPTPIKTSKQEFDDEFDSFQSAIPQTKILNEIQDVRLKQSKTDATSSITIAPQSSTSAATDFDAVFSNFESVLTKTNDISKTSPPEVFLNDVDANKPSTSLKNSPKAASTLMPQILQPISLNANASPKMSRSHQILQPLSLESYSQINWPSPGLDLQDLSRFNPVETLNSLKTDLSAGNSKTSSPAHVPKTQVADDDWGDFVSSKPKVQTTLPKKPQSVIDDDEWSDFMCNSSVKPQNGLNTISFNVHTNFSMQKTGSTSKFAGNSAVPVDMPTLNYITPKTNHHQSAFTDKHLNL